MRTALAFWRRSQVSASTSTHIFHRPGEINWLHVAIKMGLSLILAGNLLAPFAARAQNLGTSPHSARLCKVSRRRPSKAPSSTS